MSQNSTDKITLHNIHSLLFRDRLTFTPSTSRADVNYVPSIGIWNWVCCHGDEVVFERGGGMRRMARRLLQTTVQSASLLHGQVLFEVYSTNRWIGGLIFNFKDGVGG